MCPLCKSVDVDDDDVQDDDTNRASDVSVADYMKFIG